MRVVETKKYDIYTEVDEHKLIETAIVELEEVLKIFESFTNTLSFLDIECNYIEVKEDEVRKVRDLLEALMANEVEIADR
jgi:hypothetical protein